MTIYEFIECDEQEMQSIFSDMGKPATPQLYISPYRLDEICFKDNSTGLCMSKQEAYKIISQYFSNLLGYDVTAYHITYGQNVRCQKDYNTKYIIYFNDQEL